MIWCFLVLFAAFLCRLLLFAAVFWDALQLALFATSLVPKWCQNALQRPQNTSKIDPKSIQNWPKIAPWRTLGPPGGTKILFCRFGIDFGAQFGAPWDPKSTKKLILCEVYAQRSALSKQCLPGALHHLVFYILFWSFLVKKRWKTHDVVVLLAGISHPWKTMYFNGYPAWEQCLCKNAEILKI